MRRIRRVIPILALAGLAATLSVAGAAAPALAYGTADQPLAQVEISGNCDNPDFFFCSHVVGLGGIWLWIELDAGGTGDIAGAVCDHSSAGTPQAVGALPIGAVGTSVTWWLSSSPQGIDVTNVLGPPTVSGPWYNIRTPLGEVFSVPQQTGHYSWQPVNGVSLQTTVAP